MRWGAWGGDFEATVTHTGEVGSVGGGTLRLLLPIQLRWGAWGGGALWLPLPIQGRGRGAGGGRRPSTIVHSTCLFVCLLPPQ